MSTCPNGHGSAADDWCDVCGVRMGGAPTPAASSSGPGPAAPAAPVEPAADDVTCPHCGITQEPGHRFCEVCGADMTTGAPPATPRAAAARAPAAAPPTPGPSAARWEATVDADRAYFDRLGADGVEFPVAAPTRTFPLADANVLVGRRSARRGIEPQIDLAGAAEDPGVSHAQCTLVRQPDGAYSLVDNGSTNGTRVTGGLDPITPNQPVALADGDRVHVGAWTTITLHRR